MNNLCFYHSADLDGHCSGAIVRKEEPSIELIGINYGDEFPWEKIAGDDPNQKVYMVDFSLPIKEMIYLDTICDFVWIDHHKSAIEAADEAGFEPMGTRQVGAAACELTWIYFYNEPVPVTVRLLGRYDVWDLSYGAAVMPFQWGMRLNEDTRPENVPGFWDSVISGDLFKETVKQGKICLAYQAAQNTKYAGACAFDTDLDGHHAIAINRGLTNSQMFDSVWNPEAFDMMLTFVWRKGQWTVSLYTTKEDVDMSIIAKLHGGGGHKQAAGFVCDELPFPLK